MVKNTTENHYVEENIQVLEGLEPVRKRPGMYIGSTDEKGLHHLAVEILDNSIDEALAGYCTHAYITINADGSLTIEDNGRGIPCGIHKTEGVSAVEVCLTKLHAGGKFGGGGYTISGGLHGVGLSCVNALSEWLVVEVDQDGKHHYQKYMRGVPQAPLAVKGEAESTGTKITFMPDKEIFDTVLWDYDRLKLRAREVAYLNKGITIVLADNREGRAKSETFCFLGGVAEFVDNLNRTKEKIFTETVYIDKSVKEGEVEIALQFNDGYNEIIYSYANNICTEEGGAHLDGFKNALTKVVNDYAHIDLVGCHADAHTGAAEQQCLLALAAHHCVTGGHSHIGVVHAVGAVGAKVDILQTKLLQMCLDSLFQFKSAVVGGKCDGFCHGKTSFPCEWSQFRFYCLFAAASAARRSARSRSA